MIRAILFDLDGTLCDCTELHYLSLNKALKEISNFEISRLEHESIFNGLPTKKKLDFLIAANQIQASDKQTIYTLKQQYTQQVIDETLSPDPDKICMLTHLQEQKIKIACITNSITETANHILQITQQFPFIDYLISNNQVKYPKPHPEGYIRAMIYFQTMPEETLIVEDSDVGIQAANASGANVWSIKNSYELTHDNMISKLKELNG
jgi:beta-phosphoglucomutase